MRDADEDQDEETRVLSATGSTAPVRRPVARRHPGLPPPLAETFDHQLAQAAAHPSSLAPLGDHVWLVSEGPNAPRELSHAELVSQIETGRVSDKAFAWRDGMKQWQSITEIAPLATGLANASVGEPVSAARQATVPPRGSEASRTRENEPAASGEHLIDADAFERPAKASNPPRPAAGRPPAPGDRVAQGKPAPNPAVAAATIDLSRTLITQREATMPARLRPTASQLKQAGRQPNLVLWVLGATGWVVAGVLAGILIAKSNSSELSPSMGTLAAPAPSLTSIAEAPVVSSKLDSRKTSAEAAGVPLTGSPRDSTRTLATSVPFASVVPKAPARAAELAPTTSWTNSQASPNAAPSSSSSLADAPAEPAPTVEDVLNSPGF